MSYQISQIASETTEYPYLLTVICNGCVSTYECKNRHEAKVMWLEIRASMRKA